MIGASNQSPASLLSLCLTSASGLLTHLLPPQVPMIGSSSGAFVSTFAACDVDVDEAAVRAVQLFDHYQVRGPPRPAPLRPYRV